MGEIISRVLPYIMDKHDFKPLIKYLKVLDSYITPPKNFIVNPNKIKEEPYAFHLNQVMKHEIAEASLHNLNYLFEQLLIYEPLVPTFLQQLKRDLVEIK